ncbi:MAG: hypothetical protein VKJ64_09265 [Leptolyngbyaceae bacterium]|nr:hypothetical protein [Leptolyngbyaceae bacterium]
MKRHLNTMSCITSFGINREPAALDTQETQFFERCRRGTTNVTYPRHIPIPTPVFNVQRRGLTYQSAAGHHQCMALPVAGSTRFMAGTTCPLGRPDLACDGAAC